MTTTDGAQLASDLMDGQLHGVDLARAVDLIASDPVAQAKWREFNLVADMLRWGALTSLPQDAVFHSKVMAAVMVEPGRPVAMVAPAVVGAAGASNDNWFNWRLVAGVASVVTVGALAWNLMGIGVPVTGVAVGSAPVEKQVVVAAQERVMVRDPHLDALLAAHKQLGGASALQKPSGFLRNATFEGPER